MATVTGLTAARMLAIEGSSVIDGEVVGGALILEKFDGTTINAGAVTGPAGPVGPSGPAGGLIPGEMRMWPGGVLPLLASYGKWVWADGAVYLSATYPIAAGHIASQWRTFAGASDPGGANFRVPDLRGLVPAGLDQMPGGVRANRMTRAIAITLAGKTGSEQHVISVAEMPQHGHSINDPGHSHGITTYNELRGPGPSEPEPNDVWAFTNGSSTQNSNTGISIQQTGSGGGHENVQPTVFVPWIVKLDD